MFGEKTSKTLGISTIYLQAGKFLVLPSRWGYRGSTLDAKACIQDVHVVLHMCAGEGRDPSLTGQGKAAGDQSWPRGTPAAKHGVQLHLVGSETPTPGVTMSLWPLQGIETEETGPGASSFTPAFGLI